MSSLIQVCGKEIRITGKLVRIARLEADTYHFIEEPETMLDGLRKCGTRVDLFTFMQSLREPTPKYKYPLEWTNMAVVSTTSYDEWWKQITSEARNRSKQAEKKGIVIREVPFDDALVKGIWEIYNETPFRQGRPFSHYGKDLETVKREEATFLDTSIFVGAFLGEKLVGFVKLTTDEARTQANLMNILSMVSERDKAPTNALIAHSVKACANRGIANLVYQRFYYGNKKWDGLMRFKQVNGFRSVDLPRFYVPLTAFGWTAYRLGLHRKLIDRLPARVSEVLRSTRAAWNARKMASVKEGA
jgi:hypothetical protein